MLLFGATGMVGQGVLRECLLDPGVDQVLSIVRSPSGATHEKLKEIRHADFLDDSAIEGPLLKRLAPDAVTSTEQVGRAMLKVARRGAPKPVLEPADINQL